MQTRTIRVTRNVAAWLDKHGTDVVLSWINEMPSMNGSHEAHVRFFVEDPESPVVSVGETVAEGLEPTAEEMEELRRWLVNH